MKKGLVKFTLLLLRFSMGVLFFYAGITKVADPEWSATGYLEHTKTFPELFAWFASPEMIDWTNFLNAWGLTILGLLLIFGAFTRLSATLGIVLMLLYYFPVLDFPFVGEHSFIINEHIIFILVLLLLQFTKAGHYRGIDAYLSPHNIPRYW